MSLRKIRKNNINIRNKYLRTSRAKRGSSSIRTKVVCQFSRRLVPIRGKRNKSCPSSSPPTTLLFSSSSSSFSFASTSSSPPPSPSPPPQPHHHNHHHHHHQQQQQQHKHYHHHQFRLHLSPLHLVNTFSSCRLPRMPHRQRVSPAVSTRPRELVPCGRDMWMREATLLIRR